MAALTNRLADLAERIGEAARRGEAHKRARIAAHIEAGLLLAEAKAECRHGEWGAVLDRAGIHERTARDWMQLAASGVKTATVADLGGMRATLACLADPGIAGGSLRALIALEGAIDAGEAIGPDHPATLACASAVVAYQREEEALTSSWAAFDKATADVAYYAGEEARLGREIARTEGRLEMLELLQGKDRR